MFQLVERVPAHGGPEKGSAASQRNTPCASHQRKQATPSHSMQGAERHARYAAGAADAEYRDCSCGGAAREAQSWACKITPSQKELDEITLLPVYEKYKALLQSDAYYPIKEEVLFRIRKLK